jgi:predicted aspartyl protease
VTLLLGLALVSADAQTMGQSPSNGQPDQVSLEMKQLRSGIAVVTVLVNGKNRRFVIDPGSQKTSVSNEVAGLTHEKLKTLKENSTIQATGFTGSAKTVLARTSFALGTMTFDGTIVIVADFSSISDSVGEHVDGLLGQDILARFSKVTFDYKHGLLNLSK